MNIPARSKINNNRLATEANKQLCRLLDQALAEEQYAPSDHVVLELNLEFTLTKDGFKAKKHLGQVVRDAIQGAVSNGHPFQRGQMYCYSCETTSCQHSRPARPTEVFAGYDTFGKPAYHDFVQALLEDGDERAHLLYENRPPLLATTLPGYKLARAKQAVRPDPRLIGQAIVGYLIFKERFAISVQVIEVIENGRAKLLLNELCFFGLNEFVYDERFEFLFKALKRLEKELAACESRFQNKKTARERKVKHLLNQFKQEVQKRQSQKNRKTKHAQQRAKTRRPVQNAIKDALNSSQQNVCIDSRENTVIVIGRRGRVHVFAPDGHHVTSINMQKDSALRRITRGRWSLASTLQYRQFISSLKKIQ